MVEILLPRGRQLLSCEELYHLQDHRCTHMMVWSTKQGGFGATRTLSRILLAFGVHGLGNAVLGRDERNMLKSRC
eukprot:2955989-Heterocapsa_arctica.AAC.1